MDIRRSIHLKPRRQVKKEAWQYSELGFFTGDVEKDVPTPEDKARPVSSLRTSDRSICVSSSIAFTFSSRSAGSKMLEARVHT
jgi:hypothetical protein